MSTQFLERLGLTKGEANVYAASVDLGSTTAGAIIKKTGLQRSAVYFCLDSLIKKGLIGYVVKNNRKHFEANKPESLAQLLSERKKEIEKQEMELKEFIPLLFKKREQKPEKWQEAKIYDGWNGVLNAFFDAIEPLNAGSEAYAFSPTADYGGADSKRVRNLITRVRMERSKKKVRLNMLMCEDLRNTLGKDQERTRYTEVRYLPKGEMTTPAVVNLYGDITLIVLWSKIPLAFFIRSRGVADSFRNYFNVIWKQATA